MHFIPFIFCRKRQFFSLGPKKISSIFGWAARKIFLPALLPGPAPELEKSCWLEMSWLARTPPGGGSGPAGAAGAGPAEYPRISPWVTIPSRGQFFESAIFDSFLVPGCLGHIEFWVFFTTFPPNPPKTTENSHFQVKVFQKNFLWPGFARSWQKLYLGETPGGGG